MVAPWLGAQPSRKAANAMQKPKVPIFQIMLTVLFHVSEARPADHDRATVSIEEAAIVLALLERAVNRAVRKRFDNLKTPGDGIGEVLVI